MPTKLTKVLAPISVCCHKGALEKKDIIDTYGLRKGEPRGQSFICSQCGNVCAVTYEQVESFQTVRTRRCDIPPEPEMFPDFHQPQD